MVLFSSDSHLEALTLIDYYALRFQIEFTFGDAKQYFGLEDFMGIQEIAIQNQVWRRSCPIWSISHDQIRLLGMEWTSKAENVARIS
jgi:hypothetical protein